MTRLKKKIKNPREKFIKLNKIYEKNFLNLVNFDKSISVLEFDKVLEMLAAVAPTEGAKKRAIALQPTSNKESVVRHSMVAVAE